jgi:hypothetical protein
MKHLPEILRVVAKLRDPKLEVVNDDYDKQSTETVARLYYGIKSGEFPNDQVAAQVLYGETPSETKFTTLKARLKRKLLNSLFLLDLKRGGYSEYSRVSYLCNKRVFMLKTLIMLGARNGAIRLAESTLPEVQSFDLTSLELEIVYWLRAHASLLGKARLYDKYDAMLTKTMTNLAAEYAATGFYEKLILKFGQSEAAKPEAAEEAAPFVEQLERMRSQCNTYTFLLHYYRVKLIVLQLKFDYLGVLNACNEVHSFYESHPQFASPIRLGEFEITKLNCYLFLRDYELGYASVQKCALLFPKGSNNWFVYMEYYFLLTMHTQHFVEAEGIYKEISTHPRFESQPAHRLEKWRIFELYLKYALLSIPATAAFEEVHRPQLRIKTFLRSVPTYTKDKQGFNVAVLVLQILYLLESEEFDGIISRMEALKTYKTRYLRGGSQRQSSLFFKMLLVMESSSFSFKLTKDKAQKYYELLLATKSDSSDISEGLQILPFEWLWEQILEKLRVIEERHRAGKNIAA